MKHNKIYISIIVAILILNFALSVCAGPVKYFPGVTSEMSDPLYWAQGDEVLMTMDEIYALNQKTVSTSGTYMYDLKNQPEYIDGVSLNDALLKSTQADIEYYLGWTYIESNVKATQEDFDEFKENTQNSNPQKEQKVLYAIATRRTELRTFPSHKAIWDDPVDIDLDYQYLSAVRVNEPLVITSVSKDGKYYLAKNICCSGWVRADTVAICKDKDEWLSAWDIPAENALVVYGDKVFTETSVTGAVTSDLMLTMGTVLEIADINNPNTLIDNRALYQTYPVWIPVRNEDGSYSKKITLISEHNKVNAGYLPLTRKNISMVAFSALGNTYGWGGSLTSDDCSGYMRNVYKCFGLELARNTIWQSVMPMAKVDMSYMCREERIKFLDEMTFGTILYFSGHEMMYLGKKNDNYYVLSAVGSVMQPENPSVRQRIRSTIINTLDAKRSNGNTWLDDLTVALVPFRSLENTDSAFSEYSWYHDGVKYCLKNNLMQSDENKFFNLSLPVTHKEFLNTLWLSLSKPVYTKKDLVNEPDADYDAVSWFKDIGILEQEDASPLFDEEITREEIALYLYKYLQYEKVDVNVQNPDVPDTFTDRENISKSAYEAVICVFDKGLMYGKTESTFNPSDVATRAEVAAVVQRFVELIK